MQKFRVLPLVVAVCAGMAWAQAPAIVPGGVTNLGNRIGHGLPGHGVARGALFAVVGTNLGPAEAVRAELPLGAALAGTSVKVTAGETAVDALVVYTSANEVIALLPSAAPAGAAKAIVTYNEQASAAADLQIVESAFGAFTPGQSGVGAAVALNPDGVLNGVRESAAAGQTVSVFGTGLGPIEGDETAAAGVRELQTAMEAWVGNKSATVIWRGRVDAVPAHPALKLPAGVAGVDRVDVQVPDGVAGCQVPVAIRIGEFIGNFATISVGPEKLCRDASGLTGDDFAKLAAEGAARVGAINLSRVVIKTSMEGMNVEMKTDQGTASFYRYAAQSVGSVEGAFNYASAGGCTVVTWRGTPQTRGTFVAPTALDAGPSIKITKGNTTQEMVKKDGIYTKQFSQSMVIPGLPTIPGLPSIPGLPGAGAPPFLEAGRFQVQGPGGADVGAFDASIDIGTPLTWSNMDAIATVPRQDGVRVNWTGGTAGTQVVILGMSSNGEIAGTFICTEKVEAGQFTVPALVLLRLPQSSGEAGGILNVLNSKVGTFTAPNLDAGYLSADVTASKTVQYR